MSGKKYKVLIINPEDSRSKISFDNIITNEPLDLEVIYTALKRNSIECRFYDFITKEKITLENTIKQFRPDYVISNGVVHQIDFVIEYFELCKKIDKEIKTIITGSYAEYNYKELFMENVDYISRSLDPSCIVSIIKNKSKKYINGLCYKNNKKWVCNDITYFDINNLPIADRTHFYKNKNKYRYLELIGACQVRTSFSCPYNCSFCYRTMLNCSKYSKKDIHKVVEEIEQIKSDIIYFVDDDFLFDRKRIELFIKIIKEKKIRKKYICYGRVDFIIKNEDIIKELKQIGFYYILVGLEAVNNNDLKKYNKLINKDDNVKCVEILNRNNINCMGMFILDLSYKRKDFVNLYRWIKDNKLKHVALSIFTPLPGTKEYKNYKDKILINDLSKWDYMHVVAKPNSMSARLFYFYYVILVIKLFKLANKYKIYNFVDYKSFALEFLKQVFKK